MRKVAAVLFEGFEMLDLYGPLEMFSFFRDDLEIVTVAEGAGALNASGGPASVAEASFSDATRYDILLVPGGAGTDAQADNPVMLDWLKAVSATADITASVCTGSLLLGRAGLLEGRKATTNKLAFDSVAKQVPNADWQRKARWVVDGPFWTSSGVSAGTDMSVALIAHLFGGDAADKACLWGEYIWNSDPDNDPFA